MFGNMYEMLLANKSKKKGNQYLALAFYFKDCSV